MQNDSDPNQGEKWTQAGGNTLLTIVLTIITSVNYLNSLSRNWFRF